MTQEEKKKKSKQRITEDQRFRYIGFEVFPGKPKDLFKSDSEKKKYIDTIQKKRESGESIREHCTLLEDRVTLGDRVVLSIACVMILVTLFLPWFSAYNVIEEEVPILNKAAVVDSASLDMTENDSLMADSTLAVSEGIMETTDSAAAPLEDAVSERTSPSEEIIVGIKARKKVHKEYDRLSGFGVLLPFGGVGSKVFSSGFILILTGIIIFLYVVLSVLLPFYTLYGIYGLKGDPDVRALKLKKIVKLSWIPVVLFVVTVFLSFFGAEYGFNPVDFYTSLSDSYGPGVLLDTLSWGVIISMCSFILVAVKGAEI